MSALTIQAAETYFFGPALKLVLNSALNGHIQIFYPFFISKVIYFLGLVLDFKKKVGPDSRLDEKSRTKDVFRVGQKSDRKSDSISQNYGNRFKSVTTENGNNQFCPVFVRFARLLSTSSYF